MSPQRPNRPRVYGTPESERAPSSPRGTVSETSVYRQRRPSTTSLTVETSGRPDIRPIRCYNCSKVGHIKRACHYPAPNTADGVWSNPPSPRSGGLQRPPSSVRAAGCQLGVEKVYVKVTINRKCCNSLLDTGSDLTLIPAKLVDKQRIYPTTQQCIAANGTKIQILGWTSITGRIGKTPIEVNGLVTEHISELMLGID